MDTEKTASATTKAHPVRLPPAPVSRRLASSGLDYGIMYGALIAIILSGYFTAMVGNAFVVVLAAYWAVRDLQGGRFSPGKRLARFRVVSAETGEVASPMSSVLRNSYMIVLILLAAAPFLNWLDSAIVFLVMIVDIIVMVASPNNQRIGDLIAKTQVVPIR